MMSAVVGILIVLFIFPDPQIAKNLADIFNNYSLAIQKIIWIAAWGGTAYIVMLFF